MVVQPVLLLEPVDHVANRVLGIDPQVRAVPGGAVPAGRVPGRGHGAAHLVAQLGKILALAQIEAEGDDSFHFDTGAADLTVTLGGVPVAAGEEPAGRLDREKEGRAGDKLPDVEITPDPARQHRTVRTWLAGASPITPQNGSKGTTMPGLNSAVPPPVRSQCMRNGVWNAGSSLSKLNPGRTKEYPQPFGFTSTMSTTSVSPGSAPRTATGPLI